MTKSDYIFENGEPIDIESHGFHDYVYASGEPVTDNGKSSFVYESGVGLRSGRLTFVISVYNSNGDEITSGQLTDPIDSGTIPFYDGGFGWFYRGNSEVKESNDSSYYDYARTADGTIIDNFEDSNISEYSPIDDTGVTRTVQMGTVNEGDYALQMYDTTGTAGNNLRLLSFSGLNYYPSSGDTILANIRYTHNEKEPGILFFARDSQNYYLLTIDSRSADSSDTNRVRLRKITDGATEFDKQFYGDFDAYANEWLTVEIGTY